MKYVANKVLVQMQTSLGTSPDFAHIYFPTNRGVKWPEKRNMTHTMIDLRQRR